MAWGRDIRLCNEYQMDGYRFRFCGGNGLVTV